MGGWAAGRLGGKQGGYRHLLAGIVKRKTAITAALSLIFLSTFFFLKLFKILDRILSKILSRLPPELFHELFQDFYKETLKDSSAASPSLPSKDSFQIKILEGFFTE